MGVNSIFLICFGTLSLIMGILNKRILFWMSLHSTSPKYTRATNIIMGIISILVGIYLYRNWCTQPMINLYTTFLFTFFLQLPVKMSIRMIFVYFLLALQAVYCWWCFVKAKELPYDENYGILIQAILISAITWVILRIIKAKWFGELTINSRIFWTWFLIVSPLTFVLLFFFYSNTFGSLATWSCAAQASRFAWYFFTNWFTKGIWYTRQTGACYYF